MSGTIAESFVFRDRVQVQSFDGAQSLFFQRIDFNSSFPHEHRDYGVSGILNFENGRFFGLDLNVGAFFGLLSSCGTPFQPACFTTTADAPTFTINFVQSEGGPGPVPEPATWGLMIAGFGLIGHGLRRRNAKTPGARFVSALAG